MIVRVALILSGILVGTGIASCFYRRNMLAILLSLSTCTVGLMIGFASLDSEGALMALILGIIGIIWGALGSAVTYRRFSSGGTFEITDENRLKN